MWVVSAIGNKLQEKSQDLWARGPETLSSDSHEPFAPKSMCTFVEFLRADSQTTRPFSSHKERWIRKEALCLHMSSSCFLFIFPSSSTFNGVLCSNPPVFIMSRGSKLSVSSITGSSAVATNSFTPQLEDSSGLTPWRPQVEASHPAAKLSRWRSSSDLGRDRFGSWVFNSEVALSNRYERTVCAFIYQSNLASINTQVCQTFNISFLWICGWRVTCDIVMERMLLCPK